MSAEIFAAATCRADYLIGGPPQSQQRGVDPAGTEMRTKDFSGCLDKEMIGISAEVDFPTLAVENGVFRPPFFREAGEHPETDGLMGITGFDGEPQAGIRETPELAQSRDDDGPVAACSLMRSMISGHFRQHQAGQWLLDFQGKQTHAGSLSRPGGRSKCGFKNRKLSARILCSTRFLLRLARKANSY